MTDAAERRDLAGGRRGIPLPAAAPHRQAHAARDGGGTLARPLPGAGRTRAGRERRHGGACRRRGRRMTGVGGDTGRGVRVAARSVRTWRRHRRPRRDRRHLRLGIDGWDLEDLQTADHRLRVASHGRLRALRVPSRRRLPAPTRTKRMRVPEAGRGPSSAPSAASQVAFERFHRIRDRIVERRCWTPPCSAAVIGACHRHRRPGRAPHYGPGAAGRGRRLRGGELVQRAGSSHAAHLPLPLRGRPAPAPAGRGGALRRSPASPGPTGAETRHTIVSGTTGSGKTVLIADLVEQIRARGERCVVYDKIGTYTETFFDSRAGRPAQPPRLPAHRAGRPSSRPAPPATSTPWPRP